MEQVSLEPDPPLDTDYEKGPEVKVKKNNFFPNIVLHKNKRVNPEMGKKETSSIFALVSVKLQKWSIKYKNLTTFYLLAWIL